MPKPASKKVAKRAGKKAASKPGKKAVIVHETPKRICEIERGLRTNPTAHSAARIVQRAVEALVVLPVHSLLNTTEQTKILKRVYMYMRRRGLELVVLDFKTYMVREARGSDG